MATHKEMSEKHEHLLGVVFEDRHGSKYTYKGILDDGDDFYYTMVPKNGDDTEFWSCVGCLFTSYKMKAITKASFFMFPHKDWNTRESMGTQFFALVAKWARQYGFPAANDLLPDGIELKSFGNRPDMVEVLYDVHKISQDSIVSILFKTILSSPGSVSQWAKE